MIYPSTMPTAINSSLPFVIATLVVVLLSHQLITPSGTWHRHFLANGQRSPSLPEPLPPSPIMRNKMQELSADCGEIKSNNYPANYANNIRSRWSIKAPNTYYVNLSIIDFDIPSSSNATKLGTCTFDYLTLIDGYTGKRIGFYCNDYLPPPFIVSPWNELIVQFDTNSETTGRGFYFKYEFMKLELSNKTLKDLIPPPKSDDFVDKTNKSAPSQACPKTWLYYKDSCYKAFSETEPLQWYDAENKCQSHGKGLDGHLVSILDRDESLVIHHFLTNEWKSARYKVYYIGLIDGTREGLYRWKDNNPMSYTDWELKPMLLEEETPAQPDGGAFEDCTIIRYNSFSRTSNWHDVPCSLGKHYHSHWEKSTQFISFKWDYVDSYICKTDTLTISSYSRNRVRRPLYSNEFTPSIHSTHLISHLAGLSTTSSSSSANNQRLLAAPPPLPVITSNGSNSSNDTVNFITTTNNNNSSPAIDQVSMQNRFYLSALDDNRYFVCDNLEVISVILRCDKIAHCRDGSDEAHGCDPDCLDWQFKCNNGRCISIGNYCDYKDDCGDGSDESKCERHKCKLNEFRCQSGQCIPASQRCDLLTDCSDASDEGRGCTQGGNCNNATTFQCYNGNCIPNYAVCDFQIDCPGKFHEDEDIATCDEILKNRPLDYNLSYSLTAASPFPPIQDSAALIPYYLAKQEPVGPWIKENQFKCNSGNMIDANLRCIYEFDRYGYQIGCRDVSHLIDCANFECPRDYVKCGSESYCVPYRYICDGKWDCIRGDDEIGCGRYECPGQYKCANVSSCILLHQLCDGQRQCPMGDDEWFCDLNCPFKCDCIGQSVNCRNANLSALPVNYISKQVRKLDLSYNNLGPDLASSNFSSFHDLAELILSHNNIEVLIPRKFMHLRNLYKLDLSYNKIHSVQRGAFAKLRRVNQLLLESNPELIVLEPEAFLGLSSLQVLNISLSRIKTLRRNTFDGLTSLRHLQLRSNMIVEIEDGALKSLTSLLSLDLRGNDIRYFTKLVFTDLKALRNLYTDSFKFCCLMNDQIPTDKCLPLPDEISDCEDLLSSPLRILNWSFGIVAVVGNLIVIIWRYRDRLGHQKEREEEKVNSMLLLSLGCSDLLMGICQIIISVVDSYYRGRYIENADNWRESVLCNLCGFLSTTSIEASVVTLVAIARNRYTEICHQFDGSLKFSLRFTYRLILASWCLALLIATLPLLVTLYFRGQFYAKSGVCLAFHITNQKAAGWLYSISDAFNLVAFIYIANCYTKIYTEILNRKPISNSPEPPKHPVKIILIMLTNFVACLPAIIIRLVSWLGVPLQPAVYSWVAGFVLPVNSAINPLIYTIPSIWRHINSIFKSYRLRHSRTLAARTLNGHYNRSSNSQGQIFCNHTTASNGEIKKLIQAPFSTLNVSMQKFDLEKANQLAKSNFEPPPLGYQRLDEFISEADWLTATSLEDIAQKIYSAVMEKCRAKKVGATNLNLNNVFISHKSQHEGRLDICLQLGETCLTTTAAPNGQPSSNKRKQRYSCSHLESGPIQSSHTNCQCSDVRFRILSDLYRIYERRTELHQSRAAAPSSQSQTAKSTDEGERKSGSFLQMKFEGGASRDATPK